RGGVALAGIRPGAGGGGPGPRAGAVLARLEPGSSAGACPGAAGRPEPRHRAGGGVRTRLGSRLRPGDRPDVRPTLPWHGNVDSLSPVRRELSREAHRPGGDGEPRARVLLAGSPAPRAGHPLPGPPEPATHRDTRARRDGRGGSVARARGRRATATR